MQEIEDETERRQTLVAQMRLDASSSEGIKQLKGMCLPEEKRFKH